MNQALLSPPALTARRARRAVYLIRNARLDPDWAALERRAVTIAGRAIATMISSGGFNDTFRIRANAARGRLAFHLACIGRDFTTQDTTPFSQPRMRALFDHGFARCRAGHDRAPSCPRAAAARKRGCPAADRPGRHEDTRPGAGAGRIA